MTAININNNSNAKVGDEITSPTLNSGVKKTVIGIVTSFILACGGGGAAMAFIPNNKQIEQNVIMLSKAKEDCEIRIKALEGQREEYIRHMATVNTKLDNQAKDIETILDILRKKRF